MTWAYLEHTKGRTAMKVWVIMGNDYPWGVFSSEEAADKCIADLKAKEAEKGLYDAKVHWRTYEFLLFSGWDNGQGIGGPK